MRPAEARAYEHPARTAEMMWRGETVGRLFELHPRMVEGRAAILDLDLRLVQVAGAARDSVYGHPAVSIERASIFR